MPFQPTPDQPLIRQIVESDLCIACGACLSACPRDNIRPAFHPGRGAEEVEIISAERCAGCPQPCDTVCPSLQIDFATNRTACHQAGSDPAEPPARDAWLPAVYLGWSPVFRDDPASSSGGVIRAFVSHALNSGTPVVCLAKTSEANEFKPRLLTTPGQLNEVPGSIYHSTSFVGAIDLIRQAPSPVLLVAIPCQLSGVLSYIANEERELAAHIQLVCGIVCGWMYSYHSLRAFAGFKGISRPDFGTTTYRGGDRVGKIRIAKGGDTHAFVRRDFATLRDAMDYRSCFSTDYNRLRCRLCEDHLNLNADVIAGDAWLERSSGRKASIIGCRTQRGQCALLTLERIGLLKLEGASFDDFVDSQSCNLTFGTHARKMNGILRRQGMVTPDFHFNDAGAPVEIGIRDVLSVKAEMLRRRLVRAGCYRLYRWYCYLRHFRLTARCLPKAPRQMTPQ